MAEITPVRHSPPLPHIEPIKPDKEKPREQPRPKPQHEDKEPPDPDAPPHIDEYA
ncbi:hypothetical protein [Methylococcus sp. EFPC2]|uniref:hypothetical protein n=1 Tax=Methylococcus sp. EFPC2 TaxID=2812648 RepID=UPI0019686955|nr:hypothetical protein [Methylococcus sp. EFPC2]QSA98886.1 hypothetical protein JWZ97_08980 [Methylococcus sp. EFPC2]